MVNPVSILKQIFGCIVHIAEHNISQKDLAWLIEHTNNLIGQP
jgi:hypothetical protein